MDRQDDVKKKTSMWNWLKHKPPDQPLLTVNPLVKIFRLALLVFLFAYHPSRLLGIWQHMTWMQVIYRRMKKMEKMQQEIKHLHQEAQKMQQEAQKMQQEAQKMQQENQKMQQENQKMQQEAQKMQQEAQKMQQENQKMQQENQKMQQENQNMQKEAQKMQQEAEKMQKEARKMQQEARKALQEKSSSSDKKCVLENCTIGHIQISGPSGKNVMHIQQKPEGSSASAGLQHDGPPASQREHAPVIESGQRQPRSRTSSDQFLTEGGSPLSYETDYDSGVSEVDVSEDDMRSEISDIEMDASGGDNGFLDDIDDGGRVSDETGVTNTWMALCDQGHGDHGFGPRASDADARQMGGNSSVVIGNPSPSSSQGIWLGQGRLSLGAYIAMLADPKPLESYPYAQVTEVLTPVESRCPLPYVPSGTQCSALKLPSEPVAMVHHGRVDVTKALQRVHDKSPWGHDRRKFPGQTSPQFGANLMIRENSSFSIKSAADCIVEGLKLSDERIHLYQGDDFCLKTEKSRLKIQESVVKFGVKEAEFEDAGDTGQATPPRKDGQCDGGQKEKRYIQHFHGFYRNKMTEPLSRSVWIEKGFDAFRQDGEKDGPEEAVRKNGTAHHQKSHDFSRSACTYRDTQVVAASGDKASGNDLEVNEHHEDGEAMTKNYRPRSTGPGSTHTSYHFLKSKHAQFHGFEEASPPVYTSKGTSMALAPTDKGKVNHRKGYRDTEYRDDGASLPKKTDETLTPFWSPTHEKGMRKTEMRNTSMHIPLRSEQAGERSSGWKIFNGQVMSEGRSSVRNKRGSDAAVPCRLSREP